MPSNGLPTAPNEASDRGQDPELDWDDLAELEARQDDGTGVEAGLSSEETLTLAAG